MTNNHRLRFPFLFLFIVVLLTIFWAIGMHIRWLRLHRSMGTHRAAPDFASAIIKDTGHEPPSPNVSEKELVLRRGKALNGGKDPRLDPRGLDGDYDSGPLRTRAEELREYLNRRTWGRILRKCKWPLITITALSVAVAIAMVPLFTAGRPDCSIFGCRPP